jgi:hypothetical protein
VELIPEPIKLGTAGALRNARPVLRTEHVLVCNGDTLTEALFERFIEHAKAEHSIADLYCHKFGRSDHAPQHTGFTLLRQDALDDLVGSDEDDFVMWRRWLATKVTVPGFYLDLGSPRAYKTAQRIFPLWEPLS